MTSTKKVSPKAPTISETLPERGYHALYRTGQVNHCPGCGGTQWYVGRAGAECAYERCGLPLDFAERPTNGVGMIHTQNLHIPEKRDSVIGNGVIFRQDFHRPTRRMMQDDNYVNA